MPIYGQNPSTLSNGSASQVPKSAHPMSVSRGPKPASKMILGLHISQISNLPLPAKLATLLLTSKRHLGHPAMSDADATRHSKRQQEVTPIHPDNHRQHPVPTTLYHLYLSESNRKHPPLEAALLRGSANLKGFLGQELSTFSQQKSTTMIYQFLFPVFRDGSRQTESRPTNVVLDGCVTNHVFVRIFDWDQNFVATRIRHACSN